MNRVEVLTALGTLTDEQLSHALAIGRQSAGTEYWITHMWKKDLRDYCIHWVADLCKVMLVLTTLAVFYGAILLLKKAQYFEGYLGILEAMHFWMSLCTLVLLSLMFIGKGVLGIGRRKDQKA